jgi:Protein of unknown function (DUF4007)
MLTQPTNSLQKDDLRYLLTEYLPPKSNKPNSSALRTAKQWAIAANLINDCGLTNEGRLVSTKDPYLEASVTDWLIHFQLSLGEQSLWKYFVYEFLPHHVTFTQDELLNYCTEVFNTESSDRLLKKVRLLLKTYTDSQAISKGKFITKENKSYSVGNPDLSNHYTIGYLLAKVWERNFQSESAVLVDRIIDTNMGLASVLGIDKEQLRPQLDILAKYEIIEQRSISPHLVGKKPLTRENNELSYQVYRCWETPLDLLAQAYDNDIATPNRPLIQSLAGILDGGDENVPDFSQFLEWAARLTVLDGGVNTFIRLVS